MPLSKSGSYHANPAIARMHDAQQPAPDPAGETEQPPAHTVEIHHPNHPETGDGQNFHMRVHHQDGNVEESKHPDLESAHEHTKAAFGDVSQDDSESEDSDDPNEEEAGDDGDDSEY